MNARRTNAWALVLTVALALLSLLVIFWSVPGRAQTPEPLAAPSLPDALDLAVGRSTVILLERDAARVSVADPAVADILLLSPRQIYATGRTPGLTNITAWDSADHVALVVDLAVAPDATRLKQTLHQVLPGEGDIRVLAAHDALTMSGAVSSAAGLATALELAEVYAPGKVVNLMHVGGVHQVLLEVKVAEMSRSVLEKLGIDLSYFLNGEFAYTMLNQLFALDSQGPLAVNPWGQGGANAGAMAPDSAANGMFRFRTGQAVVTGFLDTLKQNGLVKILAEPTLVCRSGEQAQFLAGGEIPIPIPQGLGSTAIEYKPFGVALSFTPVVLDNDRISLKVFPEVSELDYANAVSYAGFTLPAITSRRASTTVELGDGQSFAIAGLLKDNVRENVDKYPVLGDVPILGALFRSSEFQKNKSELIIIVTPRLAKPLDRTVGLPTDGFSEPSEAEFFLLGRMEGRAAQAGPMTAAQGQARGPGSSRESGPESGLDGAFGHDLSRP